MTAFDEERLALLIRALPPAPEAWVRAAQELPFVRGELDEIVARAEADVAFRERPVAEEELPVAGSEETLALLDEALTVHEALAAAPEHCREILDRFFARDESYKTIGEALELPSGTIASRISRCLGRLREHMEGRSGGGTPSGDR